jgi:hypothetical protein
MHTEDPAESSVDLMHSSRMISNLDSVMWRAALIQQLGTLHDMRMVARRIDIVVMKSSRRGGGELMMTPIRGGRRTRDTSSLTLSYDEKSNTHEFPRQGKISTYNRR